MIGVAGIACIFRVGKFSNSNALQRNNHRASSLIVMAFFILGVSTLDVRWRIALVGSIGGIQLSELMYGRLDSFDLTEK